MVDHEIQLGKVAGRPLEVVRLHRLEVHEPEGNSLVELDYRDPELEAALVERVGELAVVAAPRPVDVAVVELDRACPELVHLPVELLERRVHPLEERVDPAAENDPVGVALRHLVLRQDRRKAVLEPIEDGHHLRHRHVGRSVDEDHLVELFDGPAASEIDRAVVVARPPAAGALREEEIARVAGVLTVLPQVLVRHVVAVDRVVEDEDPVEHVRTLSAPT